MLPKEEKQVRGSEVVARHGGGLGGYLLHVAAHHKTVWFPQTLCGTAWRNTKQKGVKGVEEVFWGVRHSGQAN